jgi:protein-S-isoprenylcysteine O-methyltransferase Ste14
MELFPPLQLGWLNGWLFLALLVLTDAIVFLLFPKRVVQRLFDRSGWSSKQKTYTILGKLFALMCILLLIFTPLKTGSLVFVIGLILAVLGLLGMVVALLDFRKTPLDQPVTRGLYRYARHPQIVMSSLVILGATLSIGSWAAVFAWAVARLFQHYGILAEEEKCLELYGDQYQDYIRRVSRYGLFS